MHLFLPEKHFSGRELPAVSKTDTRYILVFLSFHGVAVPAMNVQSIYCTDCYSITQEERYTREKDGINESGAPRTGPRITVKSTASGSGLWRRNRRAAPSSPTSTVRTLAYTRARAAERWVLFYTCRDYTRSVDTHKRILKNRKVVYCQSPLSDRRLMTRSVKGPRIRWGCSGGLTE